MKKRRKSKPFIQKQEQVGKKMNTNGVKEIARKRERGERKDQRDDQVQREEKTGRKRGKGEDEEEKEQVERGETYE